MCKAHALQLELGLDGKDDDENGMAYLCACLIRISDVEWCVRRAGETFCGEHPRRR